MIKINTSNSHSERFCKLFPRRILSYIDSSSKAFVGCTQRDKSESLRVISQQLQTKQSPLLEQKKEMIATSPAFLSSFEVLRRMDAMTGRG